MSTSDHEKEINFKYFYTEPTFPLKTILRHWAVLTDQTQMALTSLLTLLKENRPEPNYDSLPWTGKGLLPKDYFRTRKPVIANQNSSDEEEDGDTSFSILSDADDSNYDGTASNSTSDTEEVPLSSSDETETEEAYNEGDPETPLSGDPQVLRNDKNKKKKRKRTLPLPAARVIEGFGSYVHFGLESALLGNSPGLYFKNAELVMFASIYQENPDYIHMELRNKVLKIYMVLEK